MSCSSRSSCTTPNALRDCFRRSSDPTPSSSRSRTAWKASTIADARGRTARTPPAAPCYVVGGDSRARRHPAHGDGPADLRRARRPPIAAPRTAARARASTAGFQSTLSDNIQVDIWTKFVRLSVFSGMTAVTRCPIGVIVNDPKLLAMLKARRPGSDAGGPARRRRGAGAAPTTRRGEATRRCRRRRSRRCSRISSAGGRLELPWLSGAVVRIGREVGVPTPHPHGSSRPGAAAARERHSLVLMKSALRALIARPVVC